MNKETKDPKRDGQRRKMLTIIIIFLLLFGPIRVPAHQAGKGEIDKQVLFDGKPLNDACVTLVSAAGIKEQKTDGHGWANFTGLSFGQYTLYVDWNCDEIVDATHKIVLTEDNPLWVGVNEFFSPPEA